MDMNLSRLQEVEDREAWGIAAVCGITKELVMTKRLNNNNNNKNRVIDVKML